MSEAYADPQDDAPPQAPDLMAFIGHPNIATELDEQTLNKIGAKVCEDFKIDEQSRKAEGWDERQETATKLALLVREEKSYPWPKASNVKFPLVATAAIQFNARAYPAVVDGQNVVKGKVLGQPSPEKQARAERVGKHMSYQLLEEMDGWEEDTDRLLIMLPIQGCVFRKTYFDPLKGYNCSHVVSATDFVVNYWTKDLDSCPRATHVLPPMHPHTVQEKMRSGLWLNVELGQPADASNDNDAPHTFLEQHRLWDLDGDDYPEPYIVTVHKESQKVVRIVARFDEDGVMVGQKGEVIAIKPTRCFTKYGFIPAPDGSFYDVGFGTLLGPMGETINSVINQLMDAGHLANVQGGFIGDGVSIKSARMRFDPGEWKRVATNGGKLAESIVPLPVKEPSAVLFNLLGMLIESAKDVTATQDILTGDTVQANQPVGTTLAMIEQGLKTFTAIVKRIHRALKAELGILYDLNRKYLNPQVYFTFQDVEGVVAQRDYASEDIDVVPVSDPTMATDMQKLGRSQYLGQFLGKGLNDMVIVERMLEAAGIPDIEDLLPKGPPPPDPEFELKKEELAIKAHEADAKHREVDIKAAEAEANISKTAADAQKTMAEAILVLPEFQLAVAQLVDQRARDMMKAEQEAPDGGQPEPEVQPQELPGMEAEPADAPVSDLPLRPEGPVDGGLGEGPVDGPDGAVQGAPPPGIDDPGMGGPGELLPGPDQ
jgi:chaperonin GroES